MLDLDAYIDNSIEVKLSGETYHVKEATLGMLCQMDKIEADLDETNIREKRIEIALLLINNNKENKVFTKNDLDNVPFEGLMEFVNKICNMRLSVDNDPN